VHGRPQHLRHLHQHHRGQSCQPRRARSHSQHSFGGEEGGKGTHCAGVEGEQQLELGDGYGDERQGRALRLPLSLPLPLLPLPLALLPLLLLPALPASPGLRPSPGAASQRSSGQATDRYRSGQGTGRCSSKAGSGSRCPSRHGVGGGGLSGRQSLARVAPPPD
jgi:hypothetical protein